MCSGAVMQHGSECEPRRTKAGQRRKRGVPNEVAGLFTLSAFRTSDPADEVSGHHSEAGLPAFTLFGVQLLSELVKKNETHVSSNSGVSLCCSL